MTTFKRNDPFPFEFEVHSTARVGATSRTDKHGERILDPWPAWFEGKQLMKPSSCPVHPKYQALRPPRSKAAGCVCAEIFNHTRRNSE